jgi:hypothetical protein
MRQIISEIQRVIYFSLLFLNDVSRERMMIMMMNLFLSILKKGKWSGGGETESGNV